MSKLSDAEHKRRYEERRGPRDRKAEAVRGVARRANAYSRRSPEGKAIERSRKGARRCGYAVMKFRTGQTIAGMLAEQCGLCAICKREMLAVCVDHCHTTGWVRALLCNGCNSGLGLFREDISALEAAIEFVKAHGAV